MKNEGGGEVGRGEREKKKRNKKACVRLLIQCGNQAIVEPEGTSLLYRRIGPLQRTHACTYARALVRTPTHVHGPPHAHVHAYTH